VAPRNAARETYHGESPVNGAAPAAGIPTVKVESVTQRFDVLGGFTALKDVSLSVQAGEFLSVVGPSGCGKSTLLSLIAGLTPVTSGSIQVLGKPVTGLVHDIGFVFQRDTLLPWRTALENIALPLRFRSISRRDANDRAQAWLERVGLGAFRNYHPYQLSGGMRKRVAVATALAYEPRVLLMDEPYAALDVQTRNLMETDLLGLWGLARPTVVFITHDLEEAIGLSDRVIVMSASPGTVIADYPIPLSRPRDLLDIRSTSDFTKIYALIWEDLRVEVLKAQRSQAALKPV
jgi:NitT/TauT family transport system ATP-binding protein